LFWLGIIDLPLYISSVLYPEFKSSKNPFKEEEKKEEKEEKPLLLDDNQDYQDEREKDYEALNIGSNLNLDEIWNGLNSAFHPLSVSESLQGAESI
jgi:hypothetical protein